MEAKKSSIVGEGLYKAIVRQINKQIKPTEEQYKKIEEIKVSRRKFNEYLLRFGLNCVATNGAILTDDEYKKSENSFGDKVAKKSESNALPYMVSSLIQPAVQGFVEKLMFDKSVKVKLAGSNYKKISEAIALICKDKIANSKGKSAEEIVNELSKTLELTADMTKHLLEYDPQELKDFLKKFSVEFKEVDPKFLTKDLDLLQESKLGEKGLIKDFLDEPEVKGIIGLTKYYSIAAPVLMRYSNLIINNFVTNVFGKEGPQELILDKDTGYKYTKAYNILRHISPSTMDPKHKKLMFLPDDLEELINWRTAAILSGMIYIYNQEDKKAQPYVDELKNQSDNTHLN